ncbi:MAG: AraC family transcriptional regulator [Dysgonomonas sp.]|nr:AraC family transcriptional regulator [Dysgonomonas sp.]
MSDFTGHLNLILLNIGYSQLNANWNWKGVYSPFARIYYVKDGEARTIINGKKFDLKPNRLYLTPPFTLHDDECDGRFSLYYIHFYEEAINKATIFDKFSFPVEIEATSLDQALTERLLQINPNRFLKYIDPQFYDNPPTFSQYIADNKKLSLHSVIETQGILSQLISRFLEFGDRKVNSKDNRIDDALQYIHENIYNDIRLNDLSGLLHISKDHLIRIFKAEMQCTPLKYIMEKKIEKAQLMLLTTDLRVKDIAYELSIDNVSYFTRLFKSHTNKTPGEYRMEFDR